MHDCGAAAATLKPLEVAWVGLYQQPRPIEAAFERERIRVLDAIEGSAEDSYRFKPWR